MCRKRGCPVGLRLAFAGPIGFARDQRTLNEKSVAHEKRGRGWLPTLPPKPLPPIDLDPRNQMTIRPLYRLADPSASRINPTSKIAGFLRLARGFAKADEKSHCRYANARFGSRIRECQQC